jgi:hypothetical protein
LFLKLNRILIVVRIGLSRREDAMKLIRIVGVTSLIAAALFILVIGPTSGSGAGQVTYWYKGVVVAAIGAVSFILIGVVREVHKARSIL